MAYVDETTNKDSVETGEEAIDATTEMPGLEDLTKALTEAQAKAEANMAGWQRAAADMANYRRRTEQERSELVKNANADLIRRLLPVLDDLARGLQTIPADQANQAWVEGMRLIERKLLATLEQEGVTTYDALGQEFDPAFHDAVTFESSDPEQEGKVIGEVQKGYRLRDRVLRPALVRVGKGRT
jgi:molecular chaperone GrpE